MENNPRSIVRTIFGTIGRFFATCIMMGIITGCIVACVLTVYIFNLIGADNEVNLEQVELGYTSTMYYYNDETESYEELRKLYMADNNRIWVDNNDISEYVKQAVIAIEDKRFEEHSGVDWRRTFGAFVNLFIPGASTGGGSTIHQQLIKNVTGDNDLRIDRKVREIFRALELNKNYSKEQILEAYLNVVPFGAGTNGIETASLTYFGKSAKELSLAEAASIVGITKAPTKYNPFLNPENNKERQMHILHEMLDQGRITQEEYDAAVNAELNFKREEYQQQNETIMSYYEDHVINAVLEDLQKEYGWTYNRAEDELYRGGYKIYTCVDVEMQKYLENLYLTTDNFPQVWNSEYPQSCATIIDPHGKLLAVVGGWGEKTGSRMLNRATMSTRQPGSSIKPIGAYAVAFEYNRVNWSTIIEDSALTLSEPGQPDRSWPSNYYNTYYGNMTVATAIQRSTNTIPAKLVQMLTPRTVFDFMHDRLNMYNLLDDVVIDGVTKSDVGLAPMALGALTNGVTPLEMAGAYQIFANGGSFTTPYCYTRVEDADGRIILEADTSERFVIAEETAVVMNKLLQTVITSPIGTGTSANLGTGMPMAGKTGTSEYDINQWFIGMTPYYICQVWLGYDSEYVINEYGTSVPNTINYYSPSNLGYPPPKLWKTIMAPLHEGKEIIQFPESENVVSRQYCTVTGKLATEGCAAATGWYDANRLPSTCTGHPTGTAEDGSPARDRDEQDQTTDRENAEQPTEPLRVYDDSDDDDD